MGDAVSADAPGSSAVRHRATEGTTTAQKITMPPPPADWTHAHKGIPQAVAHRGYKARFPENTMGAFRGAVDAGAHAIETDLHLSKDKVVVIAHDKDLRRCYGVPGLVRDHTWADLAALRTLREPREPMPRLADLLAYLATPAGAGVWLLLDIKVDDDAEELMGALAATIRGAPPGPPTASTSWTRRIVLGFWTARQLRACRAHLPGFAVAHIGFDVALAAAVARLVPRAALSVNKEALCGAGGGAVLRAADARGAPRPLYAWTVNAPGWMEWCIGRGVDCVVTDDPKLFREVCDRYRREEGAEKGGGGGGRGVVAAVRDLARFIFCTVVVRAFKIVFRPHRRLGTVEENVRVLEELSAM